MKNLTFGSFQQWVNLKILITCIEPIQKRNMAEIESTADKKIVNTPFPLIISRGKK